LRAEDDRSSPTAHASRTGPVGRLNEGGFAQASVSDYSIQFILFLLNHLCKIVELDLVILCVEPICVGLCDPFRQCLSLPTEVCVRAHGVAEILYCLLLLDQSLLFSLDLVSPFFGPPLIDCAHEILSVLPYPGLDQCMSRRESLRVFRQVRKQLGRLTRRRWAVVRRCQQVVPCFAPMPIPGVISDR